jgi:hypothetical protein
MRDGAFEILERLAGSLSETMGFVKFADGICMLSSEIYIQLHQK